LDQVYWFSSLKAGCSAFQCRL